MVRRGKGSVVGLGQSGRYSDDGGAGARHSCVRKLGTLGAVCTEGQRLEFKGLEDHADSGGLTKLQPRPRGYELVLPLDVPRPTRLALPVSGPLN